VYGRDYQGRTINFEASGGLVHASLIMQDQETDTYWSIMEGKAVAGELKGSELVELPYGEKMQWRHWKKKHPDTLVLSVDGREDASQSYAWYYGSPEGFNYVRATDDRLETKEPVFAFHRNDIAYATRQKDLENGQSFELEDGASIFLYRKQGGSKFQSTLAFVSENGFEQRDGEWIEKGSGAGFDPATGDFADASAERLGGFDTFWYTWSLSNPETRVLELELATEPRRKPEQHGGTKGAKLTPRT